MRDYFGKIFISLVAVLCLATSSACFLRAGEPSAEENAVELRNASATADGSYHSVDAAEEREKVVTETERLRAEIEKARTEGVRLRAEIERKMSEGERQMREKIDSTEARIRESQEYNPSSETSSNRWTIMICVNGAIIAAIIAIYFYRRWRSS